MFECHITIDKPRDSDALAALKSLGDRHSWKTSFIEGDPLLGERVYFYFTKHSTDEYYLVGAMTGLCVQLRSLAIEVIRCKIERIVYDTKTGIDELGLTFK